MGTKYLISQIFFLQLFCYLNNHFCNLWKEFTYMSNWYQACCIGLYFLWVGLEHLTPVSVPYPILVSVSVHPYSFLSPIIWPYLDGRVQKNHACGVCARTVWVMWSEVKERERESQAKRWSGERETEVTGINVSTQSTHTGSSSDSSSLADLHHPSATFFSCFFPSIYWNRGATLDLRERLPAPPNPHWPSSTTTTSARRRSIRWVAAVTLATWLGSPRTEQMLNAAAFSSLFLFATCVRWRISAASAASPWGAEEEKWNLTVKSAADCTSTPFQGLFGVSGLDQVEVVVFLLSILLSLLQSETLPHGKWERVAGRKQAQCHGRGCGVNRFSSTEMQKYKKVCDLSLLLLSLH